jgi:hypothetical protein
MESNLYAPPKANVDGGFAQQAAPALWNPNGAANWCLLFTPIFGAWLHMKNWQALGEAGKAASARNWVIVSAALIVGLSSVGVLAASPGLVGLGRLSGFVLLISWYFGSARPQARYVAERFGSGYPRKGWLAPLGIALLAAIGYVFVIGIIARARLRSSRPTAPCRGGRTGRSARGRCGTATGSAVRSGRSIRRRGAGWGS